MLSHALIRRIAWGLVLIGLLATLPTLWNRYTRETGSKSVDLVLDLPALQTLALQDGRPIDDLLVAARQAGVTSVAISELSTKDIAERGLALVLTGAELRAQVMATAAPNPFLARLVADPAFRDTFTYMLPVDRATGDRLWRDTQLRHDPARATFFAPRAGEPGGGAIALNYSAKLHAGYGFGWDPADFQRVRAAGLMPLPRPRPAPGVTPESIATIYADLDRLGPEIRAIMFQGPDIQGWRPDRSDALVAAAEQIERRGWVVNLVEHFSQLSFVDQRGYTVLADAVDYRISRVFSMGQDWQDKVFPYEAVDMWWRAVLERNSRTIYLRPFLARQDPGLTASQTTMKYFAQAAAHLRETGYTTGAPDTFSPFYVPWWQKVLMGMGAVGATVLWLGIAWPFSPRFLAALTALGASGVAAMIFVMPNTGADILAIAAATIFPTLAAAWLMQRWGVAAAQVEPQVQVPRTPGAGWVLREAVVAAVTFFALNAVGGLLVAAVLGDIRHILEFVYFRGVKLVFLAPLALAVLSYLLMGRQGNPQVVVRRLAREGLDLLQHAVKYRELLLLAVLGVAGLYYIQRSGNFPTVPIPQFELEMRAALERWLLARPRTKEILIAYPALVVAVGLLAARMRRWMPALVIVAVTGGVSIINSFEHLRTPWALSLLRGVNGLWLGLLVGGLALVGLIIMRAVLRWLFPEEPALAKPSR